MDGEWSVKNKFLVFLDYKKSGFLCTNNLAFRSSKIEYLFNFNFTLLESTSQDRLKYKEVIGINFSPEIYDIKDYDMSLPVFNMYGYGLFMFKNEKNEGVIYMKEFGQRIKYDLREIINDDYQYDEQNYCMKDITNQNTNLNLTVNFEKSTFTLHVNGDRCLFGRINSEIFPEQKASITLFGYSPHGQTASLVLNELLVSKVATILTKEESHFTSNYQAIQSAVMTHDPKYFNNTSIMSLLSMVVI